MKIKCNRDKCKYYKECGPSKGVMGCGGCTNTDNKCWRRDSGGEEYCSCPCIFLSKRGPIKDCPKRMKAELKEMKGA